MQAHAQNLPSPPSDNGGFGLSQVKIHGHMAFMLAYYDEAKLLIKSYYVVLCVAEEYTTSYP